MTKTCWFWEQTLALNGIAEGTKDESRRLPVPSLFGAPCLPAAMALVAVPHQIVLAVVGGK